MSLGLILNSLALLADAFHMLSDQMALIVGIFALEVKIRYHDIVTREDTSICILMSCPPSSPFQIDVKTWKNIVFFIWMDSS